MIRTLRFFVLLAVTVSLPSMLSAGPNKTEKCTMEGALDSNNQEVMVGLSNGYQTVVYENGIPACLELSSSLSGSIHPVDSHYPDSACQSGYQGQLYVWTDRQGHNGRFVFTFGPEPCTTPTFAVGPKGPSDSQYFPFWDEDDDFCPYRLIVGNAEPYDQVDDTLTFTPNTANVHLYDGTLEVDGPYCSDVDVPVPCPATGCNCYDYLVYKGTLSEGITFHFIEDSGGGEPNPPAEEICNNLKDDDGDGKIDCADPDCKKSSLCKKN